MIWSIRSYLRQIETIEMISRRLTKIQKDEILEAYRAGDTTSDIAEKYSCTANTINRTVKNLLSDSEYILLKEKRLKINNKKEKLFKNKTIEEKKEHVEQPISLTSLKEKDLETKVNDKLFSHDDEKGVYFSTDCSNDIEVIAPLLSGFDFEEEKQKMDFKINNYESLPESVYMIVDKKVELELQLISDLPEWSFLPENELERKAILLFANQRSAKRSCSRNQRVIKIPNTSIFKISKSYLISKGITRLILDDSMIALDD